MLPQPEVSHHPSNTAHEPIRRHSILNPIGLSHVAYYYAILLLLCNCPPATPRTPSWVSKQKGVKRPLELKLNDSCDYSAYNYFMERVRTSGGSIEPYDVWIGAPWLEHPTGQLVTLLPKDMCISVDKDGNLDMDKLDCLPNKVNSVQLNGHCACGKRWSKLDLNYKETFAGINDKINIYQYRYLEGLNKLLHMELTATPTGNKLMCVASRFGHCTLKGYETRTNFEGKPWIVTKCAKHYKCRNVSVWNPITKETLYNPKTDEWWGVCISESTLDKVASPFGNAADSINGLINGGAIKLFLCYAALLMILHMIIDAQQSR